MTETKKTTNWYVTKTYVCPGHPAVHNKEGRVQCSTRLAVHQDLSLSYRKLQHATNADLEDNGWKRLKTLGEQMRMCPSCSEMILEQRNKNRARWGA